MLIEHINTKCLRSIKVKTPISYRHIFMVLIIRIKVNVHDLTVQANDGIAQAQRKCCLS